MITLTRDKGDRMWGNKGSGSGGAGGGGSLDPSALSGYATQGWVNQNYLSIEFFSKLFKAYDSSNPAVEITPNDTESTITNIKAMFGFWTEQYISALGQGSGGGGGTVLAEPLASINTAGLGAPTALNDGMTIVWDASLNSGAGGWKYGSAGGGGGGTGTVTQITTGTGLTGGPITTTGEIAISSTYQSYISHGETAYGWGNHANAGYLTSVAFSDLTSHPTTLGGYGITDAYISSGTIYLGSNNITPLTSSSNLNASKINAGTIGFSYLPTLYWANVAVSNSSSNNTAPRFLNISINGFTIEYDSTNQALKFNGSIYATGSVSALGQGSGGGGVSLNEPLASINSAALGMPTASGQVITWNGSQWIYSIPSGGGGGGTGTVTSITAGTGLSGGTITTMGTIAIDSTYQSYISHGETAYGWGNHANAGYATQQWVGQQGYLTSVAFSDLTSHPTTLSGYGITDAYNRSGTIYLGSNSITPVTTETDPTVPAWAKASTKPSYAFSEITGSVAFSQLPTLYWANVAVSNSSADDTTPKMKSLHLYGSDQFGVGGVLKFGDGTGNGYVYLTEEVDDKLTIYGNKGIFLMTGSSYKVGVGTDSPTHKLDVAGDINATLDITTEQAVNARNLELSFTTPFIDFHHSASSADYTSRLITTDYGVLALQGMTSAGSNKLSGFVVGSGYDGSFVQIGSIRIVYDSTNNALKIIKADGTAANIYATGGVTALYTS